MEAFHTKSCSTVSRLSFSIVCRLLFAYIFFSTSAAFSENHPEYEKNTSSLEQRIEQLEYGLNRQKVPHLHDESAAHSEGDFNSYLNRVNFSGFASFGASVYDAEDGLFLDGNGTTLSAKNVTVLGLQMAFEILEHSDFIIQLKAYKSEKDTIEAEWAYINHEFNNDWQLRVGAMRLPFFMLSEYMDVGYAQVWANLPIEVYGGTVDPTFTGANLGYQFTVMQSRHLLQLYAGTHYSNDVDDNIDSITIDKLIGLRYDMYLQSWRFGFSHTRGEVNADLRNDVPAYILPKGSTGDFTGIGIFYEGENFQWLNEWVQQRVDSPYQDEEGFYSSVAYNIESWTPYFTYARLKTRDNKEQQGLSLPRSYFQDSVALGGRYDFYTGFAAKVEAMYIIDEENSERMSRPQTLPMNAGKDTILYTLKLDMVF